MKKKILAHLGIENAELQLQLCCNCIITDTMEILVAGTEGLGAQLFKTTYSCSQFQLSLLKKTHLIVEDTKVGKDKSGQVRVLDSLHVLSQGSKQVDAFEIVTFTEQSVDFLYNLDGLTIVEGVMLVL